MTPTAKSSPKYERCQRTVGAFSGILVGGTKIIAGPLRCNSWDCPACHPRLKAKLYRRILQGPMTSTVTNEYGRKFLTLTYGGIEAREGVTPSEAYEEMADAYHKMIRALKKKYGHFHYFKVCELHKDGWPHFHVMLVGDRIAPKGVLSSIESLWRETYGLGFVKLNKVRFNDGKHAINYMLKYITKNIEKVAKYKRIFTASVGAMLKKIKAEWHDILVYMGGAVRDTGTSVYDLQGRDMDVKIQGVEMVNTGDRITDRYLHMDRMMWIYFNMHSPQSIALNL